MAVVSTQKIMWRVALALTPGLIAFTWVWGLGALWNIVCLFVLCHVIEAICVGLRSRPLRATVTDGSAAVTALLLASCFPPWTDFWVLLMSATGSIALAKHVYGGLGRNLFNPAMVGYAIVLISYPQALNIWPAEVDGLSGATLLTEFRYRTGMTTAEFSATFSSQIAQQQLVAMAFSSGGVALVLLKIIHWRIPAAIICGIALSALVGYDQGSSASQGGLWFHLTSGGIAMALFFVATDPVTHPTTKNHQWAFGMFIGIMVYIIRGFGVYPDGIAFAILLANCMTPLLDRYARRPRTLRQL